jgi:DNA-binding transcriptional regulator YiaG
MAYSQVKSTLSNIWRMSVMSVPPKQDSMKERPRRLADKLKQLRAGLGLSQRQMLDQLGYTGYHHAFLSMWERGYREPPLLVLLRYAQLCGISTDLLIDDNLDLPDDKSNSTGLKRTRRKSTHR